MPFVEPTREQLTAFANSGIDGPIHMLNLLKFKPEGGRESYAKYSENTMPCLQKVGGKVVYQARGRMTVIGPEHWDLILIVEYPSLRAFTQMTTSAQYLEGVPHRTAALEDSRLVCMQLGE